MEVQRVTDTWLSNETAAAAGSLLWAFVAPVSSQTHLSSPVPGQETQDGCSLLPSLHL